MPPVPPDNVARIQEHFHALIHERARDCVEQHEFQPPSLAPLAEAAAGTKAWFPVPGMYGGFHYWFEGEGEQARLVAVSWCRVVDGSGQRHEVTTEGYRLVASGFV